MADLTQDKQDTTPATPPAEPSNPSRRRLAGAALGAGAVFTLSSRPVWANQCSISGMMSGNLSKPKVVCGGCTPGYWRECQHFHSWSAAGFSVTDTFNSVFGVSQYVDCKGTPYTLLDVMYLNGGTYLCSHNNAKKINKDANPAGPAGTCTSGTAFESLGGDPVSTNLGFHAVAALLNAAHPDVNYGYTVGEIVTLFQNNYLSNPAGLKDSLEMLNERECPLN